MDKGCVLIGSGTLGLLMALCLSSRGSKTPIPVSIFEKRALEDIFSPEGERRTFALNQGTYRVLCVLGVLERVKKHLFPVEKIEIHRGNRSLGEGFLGDFLANETSQASPLAFMIEGHHLNRALYECVRETQGIEIKSGVGVDQISAKPHGAEVLLHTGEKRYTSLVISVSGKGGEFQKKAGIPILSWPYEQSAIVATLQHEKKHAHTAWEFFFPSGPLAFLPLSEGRSSLVWTQSHPKTQACMTLCEEAFTKKLEEDSGGVLGKIHLEGARQVWPLKFSFSERFFTNRMAFVGDCAHTVHPLDGLGVNFGVKDVVTLAQCLVEAARLGKDYGEKSILELYQARRRFEVLKMALAFDGIHRFFLKKPMFFEKITDFLFKGAQNVSFLKREAIFQASGLSGYRSKMIEGEKI